MHHTSRFINSSINFDFASYDAKSIHKLLFIGLSYLCDDKQSVTVTTDELMEFCLSTRPTVLSATKQLESIGLVEVRRASGESNSYRLMPNLYADNDSAYTDKLISRLFKVDLSKYDLKSMHKLILICMSSAVQSDYSVSLSVSDFMLFCMATKPTIINAIKHLEGQGIITVSPKSGSSNVYYLNLDFFPTEGDKLLAALSGFSEPMPKVKPISFEDALAAEKRNAELTGLNDLVSNLMILNDQRRD